MNLFEIQEILAIAFLKPCKQFNRHVFFMNTTNKWQGCLLAHFLSMVCIIKQNTVGPSENEDIKDNFLISKTEQLSPFKAPKSQSPCSNSAGEGFNHFYINVYCEFWWNIKNNSVVTKKNTTKVIEQLS